MKKFIHLGLILCLSFVCSGLSAKNTGREITGQCRKNLKWLNKMTAEFVKKEGVHLPRYGTYEFLSQKFFKYEYLTKKIEPPTPDCKYKLVSESDTQFQWYCTLHGVLEGDKNMTFRYKEHQISAKTSSAYKDKDYLKDMADLLHRTEYSPTFIEQCKYHYNTNPITTVLLVIGFFIVIIIAYRSI